MHIVYIVNSYPFSTKGEYNKMIHGELNELHNKISFENCNWLSEFYLISKKKKINTNIIFPKIDVYKKFGYNNSKDYLSSVLKNNNFIDYIICGANFSEFNDLFKQFKHKIGKIILWYSTNINQSNFQDISNIYDQVLSDNDKIIKLGSNLRVKCSKMLISIPERLIIKNDNYEDRKEEIFFSGSLNLKFRRRYDILNLILKNEISLELRLRDLNEELIFFKKINLFIKKNFPSFHQSLIEKKILPLKNRFKKVNKKELYGIDMMKKIKDFKFCINIHSDFDIDNAINLRVFEAMSQGSLLFSDKNRFMEKYFLDKKHVIYFLDEKDLLDKIQYYKKNIMLAKKIASDASKEIYKNHTCEKRFEEFLELIKN